MLLLLDRRPSCLLAAILVFLGIRGVHADSGLLGVGPAALAKGGACTAEADGPTAVYWNPAGTVLAQKARISISFGMLQRHDVSAHDFGNTERFFVGGMWVPRVRGAFKPYGFLLGMGKPFPRLEYKASRTIIDPFGLPQTLSVSTRRDYQEILAGFSYLIAQGRVLGGEWVFSLGVSGGVGFSEESWKGSLTKGASSSERVTDENRFLNRLLPLGMGMILSYRAQKAWRLSLGLSYRTITTLARDTVLDFADQSLGLYTEEVFALFPSDELRLGLFASLGSRWKGAVDLHWLYLDPPSVFPGVLPERNFSVRVGAEYVHPLKSALEALAVRAGFSRSLVFAHLPDSPYSCDANGFYGGVGLEFLEHLEFDFYLSIQIPTGSEVDPHFLAGASLGLRL